MCGIFGFSKTTANTIRMTGPLAIFMNQRGSDSWGVTDGEHIYKAVGPITKGFRLFNLNGPTYHTRGASVGHVTAKNAHPFKVDYKGKTVIGVHNGHIHNHDALKTKYNRKQCEVDSEQIFHHLAEEKDLGELSGWGTVVWYEYPTGKPEEKVRYLSMFNHDALHIARLKSGEYVFASTKESIDIAAKVSACKIDTFFDIHKNKKYSLSEDQLLEYEEELPWCKNSYKENYSGTTGETYYKGRSCGNYNSTHLCPLPDCTNTVTSGHLICDAHFEELKADVAAV